jgi:uncharacterized protein involved in response to NO
MQTFLSYAFRPFFLFAFIYAALAMSAWLVWIGLHAMGAQVLEASISLPPHQWHAHEMLFGYTMAAITGFFLTAVPNWTNTKPVQGTTLIVLIVAWLAGRVAIWFSTYLPPALVAGLDLSLIAILFGLVMKALKARPSKRNLVFVPILIALFASNLMTHLEHMGITEDTLANGHTLALNTVLTLIVIIGGRVIPAFTSNALRRLGEEQLPETWPAFTILAIASLVLVAIGDVLELDDTLRGGIAIVAAIANLLRMTKWQSLKTLDQPIVWVMHLGYIWLIVGFALKAMALLGDNLSEVTAMHALTVGTVGTMTIGIMTRAALGHTGRLIHASPMVIAAFTMMTMTALIRIIGPAITPEFYNEAMLISGLIWVGLYLGLTKVFWPVLTQPRINS